MTHGQPQTIEEVEAQRDEWKRLAEFQGVKLAEAEARIEAARAIAGRALDDITDGREGPAGWEEADFLDIDAALGVGEGDRINPFAVPYADDVLGEGEPDE